MNENINLCKLLKGHGGELFYSPALGNTKFLGIDNSDEEFPLILEDYPDNIYLTKEGKYDIEGECILFPSKDQRDWSKWAEEQKSKIPKIFDEIPLVERDYFTRPGNVPFELNKIQKSAIALIKIHQLIEIGYGGNITDEEWNSQHNFKYCITCIGNEISTETKEYSYRNLIAFHTIQQRNEFLSYPENVQLIKDFYMI